MPFIAAIPPLIKAIPEPKKLLTKAKVMPIVTTVNTGTILK